MKALTSYTFEAGIVLGNQAAAQGMSKKGNTSKADPKDGEQKRYNPWLIAHNRNYNWPIQYRATQKFRRSFRNSAEEATEQKTS